MTDRRIQERHRADGSEQDGVLEIREFRHKRSLAKLETRTLTRVKERGVAHYGVASAEKSWRMRTRRHLSPKTMSVSHQSAFS